VEDRMTRGFVSGIAGDVITNAFSFLAGALGWTTIRSADLIGIIVYAHKPPRAMDKIVIATFGHLMVSGVLGIGFAYLLTHIESTHLWVKGVVFSLATWYAVYSVTTLFEVPGTVPTPFNTTVTDGVASVIFGLSLAIALKMLTPRETTRGILMAPAMKPLGYDDSENGI